MKTTRIFLNCLIMALAVMATSCSPEDGRNGIDGKDGVDGANGTDGADGEQGIPGGDGNANVTLYTFPGHTFEAQNQEAVRSIPGLTEQEMLQSTWMVYLKKSAGSIYPVPGYGPGGFASYNVHYVWNADMVDFHIDYIEGNFSGQNFENIFIFRIEANTVVNGKPSAKIPSGLDLDNFHEVANYYNVKL